MKSIDVFIYELCSQIMVGMTIEARSTGDVAVEEAIDFLESQMYVKHSKMKFVWCAFERSANRNYATNCAFAGEYFESRRHELTT